MKNIYRYIFIVFCGLAFPACLNIEEQLAEELVDIHFIATTEDHANTKTTLEGELGEGTHQVLWSPEDEIAIIPVGAADPLTSYPFKNTSTERAKTVIFEGKASNADTYYAFYPASNIGNANSRLLEFILPNTLTYQEDSFTDGSFPMAAKVDAGKDISFNNLCGLLALRLTGTETVKSIVFMANDSQKVAGAFSVNMVDEKWEMSPTGANHTTITMNCGEEGVTLKETEATEFYFVLPPQVYESFDIQIITTEGGMMFKHAGKPLEIKRSVLTPSGALSYVESYAIDLSERGTANCYMIHNAGLYSFDASVAGIGNEGIIADAGYHTADAAINPSDATLLWAEPWDMISELKYDSENKRISFYTTGREGNAVIAATDAEGSILWSWHIWATDLPMEQQYKNDKGEFYVLDRNLGSTRADRGTGEEWKESVGTLYQWGRKDPNTFLTCIPLGISNFNTLADAINNPVGITNGYIWLSPMNTKLWSPTQKTIYDPCPTGYRVGNNNVYSGLTISGTMDNGWNLDYNEGQTAWYPATPYIGSDGRYEDTVTNEGYIWSSDECSSSDGQTLYFSSSSIGMRWNRSVADLYPVRCMKDDNYIDPLYPGLVLKEIGDITSNSATALSTITNNGKGDIISRGVVYGTTPTVTVENGTKVESADNTSEFTTQLSGLEMATKYYVRAFAVNEVGIAYSNPASFYTIYEGDGIDLSKDGTANSYIVPPVYSAYSFDCTVKGNSTEPVGEVASAEVIWETKNTSEAVSLGEIIPSVELQDGKVKFMLPFEPVHGNALIAIKDAAGKILWSWHVWVTDYDPETDADLYASGAKMMDRNLGALNNGGDVASYGFFYQWGRKDPQIGSVSSDEFATTHPANVKQYVNETENTTIEYAVENPTHFILGQNWNSDRSLWNEKKTKNDPCPAGWRVPDGGKGGVWSGLTYGTFSNNVHIFEEPYSIPEAYYPGPGYTDNGNLLYVGRALYCWSCTVNADGSIAGMTLYTGLNANAAFTNRGEFSVRCMKEDSSDKVGNGDDYIVDDEYEW